MAITYYMILKYVSQELSNCIDWKYWNIVKWQGEQEMQESYKTVDALSFIACHTLKQHSGVFVARDDWKVKKKMIERKRQFCERKKSVDERVLCVCVCSLRASIDPKLKWPQWSKNCAHFSLVYILICFYLCQTLSRTVQSRSIFSFWSPLHEIYYFFFQT